MSAAGGTGGTGRLAGQSKDEIDAIASKKGLIAFYPKDRELLIDFDEPFETGVIKLAAEIGSGRTQAILRESDNIVVVNQFYTKSKSGRTHAYILLSHDINNYERCLLQALFKSDPAREAFNFIRTRRNEPDSIALFETPDQAKLVTKWRNNYKFRLHREVLEKARKDKAEYESMIDYESHAI